MVAFIVVTPTLIDLLIIVSGFASLLAQALVQS